MQPAVQNVNGILRRWLSLVSLVGGLVLMELQCEWFEEVRSGGVGRASSVWRLHVQF